MSSTHLIVKEIITEHNHIVSNPTFEHQPCHKFDELTKQLLLDLEATLMMVKEQIVGRLAY